MTLTEIRKEKGFTTIGLAEKLGISQGYYSNLERGKRPFNVLLLRKTAKVLGISFNTVREAVLSHPAESYKLKSWMSNIRINGLPLIKAFQYHLETTGLEAHLLDNAVLKRTMKEFIEVNIGFSVLAELSENRALMDQIRDKIVFDKLPAKEYKSNHKSRTFHN